MSATGRNHGERQKDDFYETPYWVTRAILPKLNLGKRVLDPFAGKGAILNIVKNEYKPICCDTFGIELDAERARAANMRGHCVFDGDAFNGTLWPDADSIATNPPYVDALKAILRSLAHCSGDVAFLLRLNFLGAQERASFHKEHPADIFALPKRPGFVMAVSCKKNQPHGLPPGCGWAEVIPYEPDGTLSRPAPERCPSCNGVLQKSSSDATEYAWFVWGPGRGNRWGILDV